MSEAVRSDAVPTSKPASSKPDTKGRIIEAALETLRVEGIVGTSARAIARRGGFNQALIFYHFGSVEDVLLAVVDRLSAERLARYRERLDDVDTLVDLVRVAGELHAADTEDGHITVLSQLLAGSVNAPEFGRELRKRFDPWIELVEGVIRRVITGTPYESMVPVRDLAFTVSALFIGIELFTRLNDDEDVVERIFPTIGMMAALLGALIEQQPAPTGAVPAASATPATKAAKRAKKSAPR